MKRFLQKQNELLQSLHPVDNQLSVEDLVYEPGKLPDFAGFDSTTPHPSYDFPPTPYKTVSLFVSKMKEQHFADSDFEPILTMENRLHTLMTQMDTLITMESPAYSEMVECFQSVLVAEVTVPNFHILLCRIFIYLWNEKMKEALGMERMDTKLLATLIRDMNKLKFFMNTLPVEVSFLPTFQHSFMQVLRMCRKRRRSWMALANGIRVFVMWYRENRNRLNMRKSFFNAADTCWWPIPVL